MNPLSLETFSVLHFFRDGVELTVRYRYTAEGSPSYSSWGWQPADPADLIILDAVVETTGEPVDLTEEEEELVWKKAEELDAELQRADYGYEEVGE